MLSMICKKLYWSFKEHGRCASWSDQSVQMTRLFTHIETPNIVMATIASPTITPVIVPITTALETQLVLFLSSWYVMFTVPFLFTAFMVYPAKNPLWSLYFTIMFTCMKSIRFFSRIVQVFRTVQLDRNLIGQLSENVLLLESVPLISIKLLYLLQSFSACDPMLKSMIFNCSISSACKFIVYMQDRWLVDIGQLGELTTPKGLPSITSFLQVINFC